MLRSILAVLAGILVMGITVAAVQWLGHSIFPPPARVDPTDHDAMIALIASMPVMALAFVLLAYAFGTFLGAYTAATISVAHKRGVAVIIGVLMLALAALNFSVIAHPMWMVVLGVLIPLPFALLAWKLAKA
ncbi:hypothetical protein [Arenimonas terrae]|jgi:hypothetical protein|uniref:Uncharacterized protein n=1 Tax=Arenimonas terrae TaxID=2546226 RepID=A0A5C4RWC2_9GAMM|nr:hypothetical protein [Arenimonas terrae]TNJ35212.1 hypothetical protein E1B00_05485 [Arenimonas terrae]